MKKNWTLSFLKKKEKSITKCGFPYELNIEEKTLLEVIYWLRNKRKNLGYAIQNNLCIGPFGFFSCKKRCKIWYPTPKEACDANVQVWTEETEAIHKPDPWAYYKHCLSPQHIIFLLKNRFDYLFDSTFPGNLWRCHTSLNDLFEVAFNKRYPLYLNSESWICREFVKDTLAGEYRLNPF